ncbi:MAG: UDP-N-acetylmuramoyl-L-alanine--D-glutamate ligase [Bdellovibrionales bacterium]|nr:UDP-N-acetylmuramoyl-L-alanine--D-glutamate ligase [Bdellovibrionales bacterium]
MEKTYQKVGILGFGEKTGVSLLKKIHAKEFHIFDRADSKKINDLVSQSSKLNQQVTVYSDDPSLMPSKLDILFISPGVPFDHPLIVQAKKHNIKVQTEIDFACENLKIPMIGITGSLGKSTMAKLCHDLLQRKYNHVFLGGNYGTTLVEAVDQDFDIAVVEISSFQLRESFLFSPYIAILLNLYDNHLDRHKTFKDYQDSKLKIFQNLSDKDVALINFDQKNLMPTPNLARTLTFSEKGSTNADAYYKDGNFYVFGRKISVETFGLPKAQLLALLLIAHIENISIQDFQATLSSYQRLPHRNQIVRHEPYIFVNDSKSTTPDATLFAISQYSQPVHLIMCGQNKGISIDSFVQKIHEIPNIMSITVFGEMGTELFQKISHPNIVLTKSLEFALVEIFRTIKRNDVVLFSPGFASFDQYKNMEERGNHFTRLVKSLEI